MAQPSLPPDTALVRQVEMPKELSRVPRHKDLLAYEILSNAAAAGFRDRDIVFVSHEGCAPNAPDRYRQCVARLASGRELICIPAALVEQVEWASVSWLCPDASTRLATKRQIMHPPLSFRPLFLGRNARL